MTINLFLPIYHLAPASDYRRQPLDQPYQTPTLAEEGFIHCTAGAEKLVEIANIYFADLRDELFALEIDPARLTAPLRFEPPIAPAHTAASPAQRAAAERDTLFPHIYGPLDRQAIVNCIALQRDSAGRWQMPE
ncbi:MAG: hypothetical protein DPW09_17665 [Anaerolineae bacterium]|nr:DUF952 domain-containing protein [Anaerolineales bacterium]MCQ3975273.1 hypothetical protein [Anaerolineae bacterium]